MSTLATDLALTLRALRRRRGFATAVVATLGLALGASGVVAAAADRALLRPLPFDEASRVVLLWEAGRGEARRLAAYPTFLNWQRDARRVALGYARGSQTLWRTAEGSERLTAAYVSPGFLRVLGAHPRLGRAFTPDEERPGRAENVAVVTDALWRRAFGGDVAAVGHTMELDGRAITIIGVLPPGQGYPLWADVLRPIAATIDRDPALHSRHHHSDSRVIARLNSGVDLATGLAELATIERRLAATYAEHGAEWTGADSKPLTFEIVGESTAPLRLLAGAVALVLLVASANVATLLLLRALERDRELAVRAALGATRARLACLVSLESAMLGVAAMVLGLALTALGLRLLRDAAPTSLPRASELALDGRSALMLMALGVIATALTAVGPMLHVARIGDRGRAAMRTFDALRSGRGSTGTALGSRVRGALTVVQLALALALLAGAGLLLESFRRLRAVNLGFDPTGVTVFWVSPPRGRYDSAREAAALYERLLTAVAAVPGVEHVALANHVPLSGGWIPTNVVVPGRTPAADGEDQALYKTISTDYLAVMRTSLRRGRWLQADDERSGGASGAVVINEAMARRFWPGTDPVGKAVTIFRSSQARPDFGQPEPSIVVGVVADIRHLSVADDPVPEVYVPYTQEVWPAVSLLVRSRLDTRQLEPALRRAILSVEPELPVRGSGLWAGFRSLGGFVSAGLSDRRSLTTLVASFAAAALALSALGLYGIVAFGVAQRRREFGIRLAVGATPRDVRALVVGQGMRLVALGVIVGLATTVVLTRFLGALLFHMSPFDLRSFATAAAVLVTVALAGSWLPARRASKTDPVIALREEG